MILSEIFASGFSYYKILALYTPNANFQVNLGSLGTAGLAGLRCSGPADGY